MFQMALLLQGKHLCQSILKSMHKRTSYGPDKSRQMHTCTTHTCTYTKLESNPDRCTHAQHTHAHTPNWSQIQTDAHMHNTHMHIHQTEVKSRQMHTCTTHTCTYTKLKSNPDRCTHAQHTHAHTPNWSCNNSASLTARGFDEKNFMILGGKKFEVNAMTKIVALPDGPWLPWP